MISRAPPKDSCNVRTPRLRVLFLRTASPIRRGRGGARKLIGIDPYQISRKV